MASKRTKKDPTAWRNTPAGIANYNAARAVAQARADETGYDYGIEPNDVFKEYSVRVLPARGWRSGYELRCEIVMCSYMSKCKPGHGPVKG